MIGYISKKVRVFGLIALSGLSTVMTAQFDWTPAGPVFTAGRSRNIIVDKNDPTGKTLYTGSASSGVFTSTNGGLRWTPIDDQGTIRNISYMAQGSGGIIYASTGEGFLRDGQLAKAQVGTGLYKLSGNTLTIVASSAITGTVINRIACHPTNPDVIALATNKGILITTNATSGASFNLAQGIPTLNTVGMDVKFDGDGVLYCTVGGERTTGASSKIYKSGGSSVLDYTQGFNEKTPLSNLFSATNYGRIELAIAPSNNYVIYASIANKATNPPGFSSSLLGLFVSYDGGTTWGLIQQGSPQLDPLSNGANIASGDYAQVITVNPSNSNQLFIGGYFFMIYTRTNLSNLNASPLGNWAYQGSPYALNTPYYLHENIHDIKIVGSGAAAKFYFVTDAGIFRSIDLAPKLPAIGAGDLTQVASFQPFYKGLVTGQFNSVSIQSFPTAANATTAATGESVSANDGYIGGTGGNGLTYFNGRDTVVLQETNYLTGEVYNSEFSKILPKAAFFTANNDYAGIYRTTDIETSDPALVSVNSYTGALTKITPVTAIFSNDAFQNVVGGSPFKLWENYGQVAIPADSLVFYNDSVRIQTSLTSVATLTTQTTFTFSSGRPSKFALIDSIAIRTGTVVYDLNNTSVNVPFTGTDKKDIFIKLANNYPVNSGTATTIPPISTTMGPVSAAGVTLDPTGLDNIAVTFTAPPFATKTSTSSNGTDPSVYYKVFATIFYKYSAGDTITITDNSISTHITKYTFPLATSLRWSASGINGPKPFLPPTNPVQKVAAKISARLAVSYRSSAVTNGQNAVLVSKAPLNLNDPLSFVRVSQSGALTMDANGVSTNSTITIPGKPVLLQWANRGTELYYATDDYNLYRVSNLGTILDFSQSSYSGKLTTDIFKYNSPPTTSINPNSPYRTTLLGTFTKPITSISIAKNDSSMVLTFNDPTGTIVMRSGNNIIKSDYSNINFASRTGSLTNIVTYCSLLEKDDSKKMFLGTDNGLYYTADITPANPTWVYVNKTPNCQLPNVQIFDIKQQTVEPWNCYNSGQIFLATNGRGVWTNRTYFDPYVVSVEELGPISKAENNLRLYPNPTNGQVFVSFNSVSGESAVVNVMDINGRLVKTESMGKLNNSQVTYSFDTNDLSAGMYIVTINGTSGIKRVAKLIVAK